MAVEDDIARIKEKLGSPLEIKVYLDGLKTMLYDEPVGSSMVGNNLLVLKVSKKKYLAFLNMGEIK